MVRFYSSIQFLFYTAFALAAGSGAARAQYWVPANTGLTGKTTSLAIAANGDIFAGTVSGILSTPAGVYVSTDNGNSWTLTPKSPSEAQLGPVYGIDSKGAVFVGGSYEYFSTNNGTSWQQIRITPGSTTGDPLISSFAIAPDGYMFIATGGGSSMYATSNYGNDWYTQGSALDVGGVYPTFVASSSAGNILAGTPSELEQATSPQGGSWNQINGTPGFGNNVTFAFSSSTMIVAGGTSGLFVSLDNGATWSSITPQSANGTSYALAIGSNGNIFAGMSSGGMLLSTDTGQHWNDISSGLTSTIVNALAFDNNGALYAATNNGVFLFNPNDNGGVKSGGSGAPASLSLDQNTPNPVTSSTTIHFTVPESGPVSLRVFDPTGRAVTTVASGYYLPGSYDVSFDAQGLPNGPYYYRIESGEASSARMFVIAR
jgi:photosystem II stability/assembly factor-like uncharacterized protein